MNDILPDCMMPDGADPCKGYTTLLIERDRLRAENKRLNTTNPKVEDALFNLEKAILDQYKTENTTLRAEVKALQDTNSRLLIFVMAADNLRSSCINENTKIEGLADALDAFLDARDGYDKSRATLQIELLKVVDK